MLHPLLVVFQIEIRLRWFDGANIYFASYGSIEIIIIYTKSITDKIMKEKWCN